MNFSIEFHYPVRSFYIFAKLRGWAEARWEKAKYPPIRAGIVDIPILALDSVLLNSTPQKLCIPLMKESLTT